MPEEERNNRIAESSFHRIMRSEAHYAARLFCCLSADTPVRSRFTSAVERQTKYQLGEIIDVFVEPA